MLKKISWPLLLLAAFAITLASCSKSEDIYVEVKSVEFSARVSSLYAGDTYKLGLRINPSNATEPFTPVFSSSNPQVASVDDKGLITALKAGQTVVSVSMRDKPGIRAEYTLTVQALHKAPENKRFQKVAYFPSYRTLTPSGIPDAKLRMVDVACFAFASIQSDYTLKVDDVSKLQTLVARCKSLGVKVLISLNGAHASYAAMTSAPQTRQTFIQSLKSIVDTYGLDGVDNDWEYPKTSDGSSSGNTKLMKELSSWLHDPAVGKLLTMAITPGKYEGSISNGIEKECFDYVDWFNIMVYDDFSNDTPGINHSPFALLTTAYNYWVVKRSMPKYKFVGGIPVYGRSSGLGKSISMSYVTILEQGGDPDKDQATVTSPSYDQPFTVYYNGRVLVREKTRYCIDQKLGGVMFWEAGQDSQDDRSLIKAAYDEIGSYKDI